MTQGKKGQPRRYRPWDRAAFRDEYRRLFPGVRIDGLYDPWLSYASGELVIDILRLAHFLSLLHPSDWERMSMRELIVKHYGQEAMQLIDRVS